jgi:hypothetical protein
MLIRTDNVPGAASTSVVSTGRSWQFECSEDVAPIGTTRPIENSVVNGGSLTPQSQIGQINEHDIYARRSSFKQGAIGFYFIPGSKKLSSRFGGTFDSQAIFENFLEISVLAQVFSSRTFLLRMVRKDTRTNERETFHRRSASRRIVLNRGC